LTCCFATIIQLGRSISHIYLSSASLSMHPSDNSFSKPTGGILCCKVRGHCGSGQLACGLAVTWPHASTARCYDRGATSACQRKVYVRMPLQKGKRNKPYETSTFGDTAANSLSIMKIGKKIWTNCTSTPTFLLNDLSSATDIW
jgi:hypothetical protein